VTSRNRDASISGLLGTAGLHHVAECVADEEFGGCGEYLEITPPASFMWWIVALSGSARK
jgi:hypothetical protein